MFDQVHDQNYFHIVMIMLVEIVGCCFYVLGQSHDVSDDENVELPVLCLKRITRLRRMQHRKLLVGGWMGWYPGGVRYRAPYQMMTAMTMMKL